MKCRFLIQSLVLLSLSSVAFAAESIPEAVKESLEGSYGLECTESLSGYVISCRDEAGNRVMAHAYKLDDELLEISFSPFLAQGSGQTSLGFVSEKVLGMQLAEDVLTWFDGRGFCTSYEAPMLVTPWSPGVSRLNARCVDAYDTVVRLKAIISEKDQGERSVLYVSKIRMNFEME